MNLTELGLEVHFRGEIPALEPNTQLARINSVNKDSYTVLTQYGEMIAEITGKLIFGVRSSLDLPAVGDWVQVQIFNNTTLAIITKILPRRSTLKRKVAGKKTDYQLIAANVDVAFIVQSLDSNFNIPRLERYLVMVNDGHTEPVILFSKSDLQSKSDLEQKLAAITAIGDHITTIPFSNLSGEGLPRIKKLIKPRQTYCLLGSSGVGKTTLLNKLVGDQKFAVSSVRERDGKGRHVTSRRHLIILENGGIFIDTPGMRELGNIGVDDGLAATFSDIEILADACRFKNCSHSNEKGCAVIAAVNKGDINSKHYQNYLKLKRESEHYNRSYFEKRRRDRAFGKMVHKVMKSNKKKL